jgi:hypothetical protein
MEARLSNARLDGQSVKTGVRPDATTTTTIDRMGFQSVKVGVRPDAVPAEKSDS